MKKKKKQAKTFVECHNTCARSSGRTCKYWGGVHTASCTANVTDMRGMFYGQIQVFIL